MKGVLNALIFGLIISILIGYAYMIFTSKTKVEANIAPIETSENSPFTVSAWLPWWNFDNAIKEYEENSQLFTSISPFIYVLNAEGSIESKLSTERMKKLTNLDNVQIIPTIYNEFDPKRVHNIIDNATKRAKHISDIKNLVLANDFDGVEIDYEYLNAYDKENFSLFIRELSDALRTDNKILIVTLHAKTTDDGDWPSAKAQDWKELGMHANHIRIMAYDYHSASSDPGPIAPIKWVEDVAFYAKGKIPKEKLIMGIGLYGYKWGNSTTSQTLIDIQKEIDSKSIKTSYNSEFKSPFFSNSNEIVWYENEISVENKISIAIKYYSGISLWSLGGIPSELFQILNLNSR